MFNHVAIGVPGRSTDWSEGCPESGCLGNGDGGSGGNGGTGGTGSTAAPPNGGSGGNGVTGGSATTTSSPNGGSGGNSGTTIIVEPTAEDPNFPDYPFPTGDYTYNGIDYPLGDPSG